VDLMLIIREIEILFSDKANKKGLKIDIQIQEGFPELVSLDEIRIKQIIFNLVGNAIKFTHHGYVRISLLFNKSDLNFGLLQLQVTDTGIGIPKSQQQLIFEAFQQQSGQSTRKYGGAGLGLAISRRLVEKMDGFISLESEEGKGTTFAINLPNIEMCSTIYRRKREKQIVQEISFDTCSILVVDDVSSNIEAVENLLVSTGLNISSADSGEIALEIVKHTTPDLILLDIRMPGLTGFEVAKLIKSNARLKHIPVIAFTASVMSSTSIDNSPYFDDVVYKPVNRNELIHTLAKYLNHSLPPVDKSESYTDDATDIIIPENVKRRLPVILGLLNDDMLPLWNQVKDSLVLFAIEEFAIQLHAIAVNYDFDYLKNYCQQLMECIEAVDIELLRQVLKKFPNLIEQVEHEIVI